MRFRVPGSNHLGQHFLLVKMLPPSGRVRWIWARREEPSERIAGYPLPQYHGVMNLGLPEMIFIFLLALIIFGPKKLPEIGRQIGKALNEFKRASNELKAQIETEISNMDVQNTRAEIEK